VYGRTLPPAYEGAPASCFNPYASLQAGAQALRAGPDGVIVGRFGFSEPASGLVSNALTSSTQRLGLVLPQWGTFQKLYCQDGTWILREGLSVVLESVGDFWVRFMGGAYPGQPVFASTLDGSAATGILGPQWTADSNVTADSVTYTADGGGWQLTQWTCCSFAPPGGLGLISTWQTFSPNN